MLSDSLEKVLRMIRTRKAVALFQRIEARYYKCIREKNKEIPKERCYS